MRASPGALDPNRLLMRKALWSGLFVCLIATLAVQSSAYTPPPLEWKTIKTEHFEVHFHEGAEWTARQVAQVAEEIYGPITELYQYEPSKVHFVIRDTHDYANGAAYFYDNKVEIWATNLEFGFRGTTDWIRNVVTHEYTHIVSIQASTKMPMWMPAIYFQVVTFEDERRPDVLQGYPKDIVSYPFSGVGMPPWFAEGVAQYQAPSTQFDCWDAHRDMILRTGVLEDKMLSYNQMSYFGNNGMQNEQIYDHGYGMVTYLAQEYGDNSLREIAEALQTVYHMNIEGALKAVTGKKGKDLYADWRAHLEKRYEAQIAGIVDNQRVGKLVDGDGYLNVMPTFSPDGGHIAYLSNEGSEFSITSLFIAERDGSGATPVPQPITVEREVEEEADRVAGAVSSSPAYSPDGKKIIYSRKVKIDKHGSAVNDLFVFDTEEEKEERLTEKSRWADASYSPDGQHIVCVHNTDGTHTIMRTDAEAKNPEKLFSTGVMGTQIYNPRYSPDGSQIVFGIFEGVTRDIAVIDADGSNFRYILKTASDERDVRWARGGNSIVFASERSGIYNICEMDLETQQLSQLTNVIGGALMPDVSPDGELLTYAGFSGDGYGVYELALNGQPVETMDLNTYAQRTAGAFDECKVMRSAAAAAKEDDRASFGSGYHDAYAVPAATEGLGSLDGLQTAEDAAAMNAEAAQTNLGDALEVEKYDGAYSPFQIFPRMMVWDNKVRLGLFLASYELLDKQSLFAGGAYGIQDNEYDGYLLYEMRNLLPVIFADFLVLRERTSDFVADEDIESITRGHTFDYNVRYDLWQFSAGLRLELAPQFSLVNQHDISLYYTHAEYSVNLDGQEYDESGDFVQSFDGGWKYYVGNQVTLSYMFRYLGAYSDVNINPRGGRQVFVSYMRAFDELFSSGEFEYAFRPQFDENNYGQFTLDWREYFGLPWWRHSLRVRLYGSVLDEAVDDFFWVYMGGRDYIRGYTFYSIGGRKGALASLTYRFPLLRNIDKQLLQLSFRHVYGSVFVDYGNAWAESGFQLSNWKTSAGYELRASMGSYYVFPTSISLMAAYAFDPIRTALREDTDERIPIVFVQDPGWTYYFTLGFAFDL